MPAGPAGHRSGRPAVIHLRARALLQSTRNSDENADRLDSADGKVYSFIFQKGAIIENARKGDMTQIQTAPSDENKAIEEMLRTSGYSQTAIDYYMSKPHMGHIANADITSEMTGTCGDTMAIYIKMENGLVSDAKYQVMGCAGAISAAMAVVDLIKGKNLDFARSINDGSVFKVLEEIPAKKHHCIQLAVKTLHKALDAHRGPKSL
jgi:nitrogen fixation protein NifU and related proteins